MVLLNAIYVLSWILFIKFLVIFLRDVTESVEFCLDYMAKAKPIGVP